MNWASSYVGIPYLSMGRDRTGCDCWGLARLVYGIELNINLPSYAGDYACAEEQAEVQTLIGEVSALDTWTVVRAPRAFDLHVFRHGRWQSHIGIAVDATRMLHVAGDDQSKIEDMTGPRWQARHVGIYRHVNSPSTVPL